MNLGSYYWFLSKIKNIISKAIESSNKVFEIYKKKFKPLSLGDSYLYIFKIRNSESNLEKSIESYKEALELYKKESHPSEYVKIQMCLGESYSYLSSIKDKESNLEKSIESYKEALEIYKKESHPSEYAKIQMSLGESYGFLSSIKNKESNIEKSIESYKEGLEIYKKESHLSKYGEIKIILGLFYYYLFLIKNKEINLEKSIESYKEGLEIYKKEYHLSKYGEIKIILCLFYCYLSLIKNKKNKEINLEKAIELYNKSSEIFTIDNYSYQYEKIQLVFSVCCSDLSEDIELLFIEKYPYKYVENQINLGGLYRLISNIKEKEINLEKSIESYNKSLNIFLKTPSLYRNIKIQMNLSNYFTSISNKECDIEQSIDSYNKALEIFTIENYSYQHALMLMNLVREYKLLSEIRNKEKNLEKSIELYNKALDILLKKEYPYRFAIIKISLSNSDLVLYEESNLEKAIKSYKQDLFESCNQELEILTIKNYPYEYARIQMSISNSRLVLYEESNIEKAIDSYNKALEIFTIENYSYQQALILINLAIEYNSLSEIRNKEKNLEKSIELYNKALDIYIKKNYIYGYSFIQMNLGSSYTYLSEIKDKESNIEKAIELHNKALEVFTIGNYDYEYANTQMNLGNAYWFLFEIKETIINLKKSIESYNKALEIFTIGNHDYEYANTQMNLGNAYWSRSRIKYYVENSSNSFLFTNIFNWDSLVVDHKKLSLKKAIESYNKALEIFTIDNYGYEYGKIQMNLGVSYNDLSKIIDKEINIKKAIESYNKSLKVFTKKNFPYQYALLLMNLAFYYDDLSKTIDEENNLKKAILNFQESINYSANDDSKILTYINYSYLLINHSKYKGAYTLLNGAIKWIEQRRIDFINSRSKESILKFSNQIYSNMIKICLILLRENTNNLKNLNYYQKELFKYIEMSKTRTLIDVINSKENGRIIFDESLSENYPELVNKIKSLNEFEDSIANIEKLEDILSEESSNLRGFISESKLKINSEKLKKNKKKKKELERKKKDLLDELYKYPHIKARLSQINGKIIPLNELISMIGNQISSNTSILQYYISEELYVINVINENKNKNKNENITTFFQDDFEKVSKLNFWLGLYSDCFDLFGLREEESYFKDKVERIKKKYINLDIKDLDDDKFKNYILSLLGKELYKYLIEPIEEFIQGNKRLMFISDSKLHNFSFNILQKDDKFLIDYLYLYKLPSASLWVSLKDKMNQDFKEINVFATSEYNKYTKLKKVSKEVSHIENTFKKDLNLYKDNDVKPLSIKEKIKESSILTLIGHGYYEDKDSGYIYIDGEEDLKLSISTIFSSFPSFDRNMLVILSICHGGKQLFSGQEIIGINSVFLMLGAGGIISNLIELSDEIAEKFSEIFYEKLSNRIIYKDSNEDKLDIFYQSIRELKDLSNKSKRVNKIADWAFLEFQGNPSF